MSAISRSRRIAFRLLAVLALIPISLPAQAQVPAAGSTGEREAGPLSLFRQRVQTAGTTTVPQEGPVDPDEYVAGPGDVFGISISGLESITAAIPVAADGTLSLPDAGVVRVAGKTLAEAIDSVTSRLVERFSNVEVSVTLAAPRQFYVHVVGAVTAPGRYLVLPVSRVSDALTLAYRDTARTPVGNPDFQPSLRNVAVYRRDGSQVTADIMAYLASGATDLNPYLRDGDVVTVPAYNPDRQSVSISGNVTFPGTYDHRPGESVRDLVAVASGIRDSLLEGSVRLTRQTASGRVDEIVSLDAGGGRGYALQERDHVFVLPERQVEGFAHIEGRVRFPGSYPIIEGTTTVGELVKMAGGFRSDALLRGAYLSRDFRDQKPKMAGLLQEPGLRLPGSALEETPEVFWSPYLLTSPSAEALRMLRLSGLDYANRIYLTQELALMNLVSLDLTSDSDGTVLLDGDRLVVPRDEGTVFVFGQVNRPGFVSVRADGRASDYLDEAGGRSAQAGDIFVIEAGTRRYLPAAGTPVDSGDMIFVSRRSDVADFAELQRLVLENKRAKAESRTRIVTGVLQAVSTVGTLIALIVTLRNN